MTSVKLAIRVHVLGAYLLPGEENPSSMPGRRNTCVWAMLHTDEFQREEISDQAEHGASIYSDLHLCNSETDSTLPIKYTYCIVDRQTGGDTPSW
jgi:hypothetical protein